MNGSLPVLLPVHFHFLFQNELDELKRKIIELESVSNENAENVENSVFQIFEPIVDILLGIDLLPV